MFGVIHQLYVPPAWTLGLETRFYLVFPLFWLLPQRWKYATIAASMLVFASAYLGLINTDWYGYRLLLGTFFIFAAGCAPADPKALSSKFPKAIMILLAIASTATFLLPSLYAMPYNMEVTTGTVIGVGAVTVLRNYRFNAVDELLGNLSYGVFLIHCLLIFISDKFKIKLLVSLADGLAGPLSCRIQADRDACLKLETQAEAYSRERGLKNRNQNWAVGQKCICSFCKGKLGIFLHS